MSKLKNKYGISLDSIAFGDVKLQLQFDDIIETEDGWKPVGKKPCERTKCKRMYERNSTMDVRKGLRFYL